MSEFVAPVDAPVSMPRRMNPLRLASSILFFVVGIAGCFNGAFPVALDILRHISDYGTNVVVLLLFIATVFIVPIAGIALGIMGLVDRRGTLHFFGASAVFLIVGPISWLVQAFYIFVMKSWTDIYWTTAPDNGDVLGWLVLAGLTLATALTVVAKFTQKKLPVAAPRPVAPAVSAATPVVGNGTAPLSNLPVFALVAAFIVPIAAVILGHISLGQINRGQISNQNRGLAVAGLVLGYVFMALSIIATVLFAIIFALSQHPSYY